MKTLILFLIYVIFTQNSITIAQSKIEEPNTEALAAILLDAETGRVLWEKNGYKELPMASTTKIMTLLIALENGNLEDIVTVSSKAASQPKVRMNLKKGEEIKLEHLLYALMLNSFNDAAVAIAEHISGTVEEFTNLMTERAKEFGAYNTSFKTPSGLDADGHFSTAFDMAIITKEALKNEDLVNIITTETWQASSTKNTYSLVNKNRLLYEVEGAYGVKTGFTGKAGHCFVGSVKKDNFNFITVVLGSGHFGNRNQKWKDTKAILKYGFENFTLKEIWDEISIPILESDVVEIFEEKSVVKLYVNNKLEMLVYRNDYIEIEAEDVEEKNFFEDLLDIFE